MHVSTWWVKQVFEGPLCGSVDRDACSGAAQGIVASAVATLSVSGAVTHRSAQVLAVATSFP
jgi:hypothetical protein